MKYANSEISRPHGLPSSFDRDLTSARFDISRHKP